MVAPKADDGVVGFFETVKMVKQATNLCIGEANPGAVTMDQTALEVDRDRAFLWSIGIVAQFPRIFPGVMGVPSGCCCSGLISIVLGS